jgi:hypothetical protein
MKRPRHIAATFQISADYLQAIDPEWMVINWSFFPFHVTGMTQVPRQGGLINPFVQVIFGVPLILLVRPGGPRPTPTVLSTTASPFPFTINEFYLVGVVAGMQWMAPANPKAPAQQVSLFYYNGTNYWGYGAVPTPTNPNQGPPPSTVVPMSLMGAGWTEVTVSNMVATLKSINIPFRTMLPGQAPLTLLGSSTTPGQEVIDVGAYDGGLDAPGAPASPYYGTWEAQTPWAAFASSGDGMYSPQSPPLPAPTWPGSEFKLP